ncbi:MAG: tRNA (N6-threonylcarbamoyladenosine(37)-N6)-methyltransferase TrmO [Alphaproteobacteria bacterium]|jgi:tRNA-Thr(GGU) m(6)t(6)A37 methyltransferase TsaA
MSSNEGAALNFIGRIITPYLRLEDCPRTVHANPAKCTLVLKQDYADGLFGLEQVSHVLVLYWLQKARRDMLRRPGRSATSTRPAREELGVFACRTPLRPNPIAASNVEILDIRGNEVDVLGLDCLNGTPLVDIKRTVAFSTGAASSKNRTLE